MLTVQEPEKLSSVVDNWIQAGESLALVPTMGNLHAGHMALVERAVTAARRVVVSLYVNPAQFGPGEDLDRYPRTPDSDATRLEAGGCDLLWAPSDAVMYPHGIEQAINFALPAHLTDTLEGVFRPGHFAGVAAVVARLFNQVRPNAVVFGEKDYQQLTLIRHLVGDLGYPISVEAVETVREADGLAMSSRNAYWQEKIGNVPPSCTRCCWKWPPQSVNPGIRRIHLPPWKHEALSRSMHADSKQSILQSGGPVILRNRGSPGLGHTLGPGPRMACVFSSLPGADRPA